MRKLLFVTSFCLFIILLALEACGGAEMVVNSSTTNSTDAVKQENENDGPIHIFDGPEDPLNGGK